MPKRTGDYMAARRDEILDAAVQCFIEKGFHATALKDIIARSGLSNGAIYTHFKSKQEMVNALMQRSQARRAENLQGGSLEQMRKFLVNTLGKSDAEGAGARMSQVDLQLLQESFTNDDARQTIASIFRSNEAQFANALEAVEDSKSEAARLNALYIGASLLALVAEPRELARLKKMLSSEVDRLIALRKERG